MNKQVLLEIQVPRSRHYDTQLLLVDFKARISELLGTGKWVVPDGGTQEIMSQS